MLFASRKDSIECNIYRLSDAIIFDVGMVYSIVEFCKFFAFRRRMRTD